MSRDGNKIAYSGQAMTRVVTLRITARLVRVLLQSLFTKGCLARPISYQRHVCRYLVYGQPHICPCGAPCETGDFKVARPSGMSLFYPRLLPGCGLASPCDVQTIPARRAAPEQAACRKQPWSQLQPSTCEVELHPSRIVCLNGTRASFCSESRFGHVLTDALKRPSDSILTICAMCPAPVPDGNLVQAEMTCQEDQAWSVWKWAILLCQVRHETLPAAAACTSRPCIKSGGCTRVARLMTNSGEKSKTPRTDSR